MVLEEQEGHDQDIICYLGKKLNIGHSKIAEQIRIDVQEKASRVFLWVVLVVEILNKEYDHGRIHALRNKIRHIPGDVHELFHDILTRDHDHQEELLLCIQWVLFARQPLAPEELYFAVLSGIESGAPSKWDAESITVKDIGRYVIGSSKGLAEVTRSEKPTVQFIHESVRDFLLKENGLKEIWPDLGTKFQGKSHQSLKRCCLTYISTDLYTNLDLLPKASSEHATELREWIRKAFPFSKYAVQNVLYHADAAEGGEVEQTSFLEEFQLDDWIELDNIFTSWKIDRHTPKASLLYILAENNLGNLIRRHPLKLSCFEMENECYVMPIFAALATNRSEAVRSLLEAQVESKPPLSPLHDLWKQYNPSNNRPGLLQTLMFVRRREILSYLTEIADEAVTVAFLLAQNDCDTESKYIERTPLSWAAARGHETIVELLLETGRVDVEAKDFRGRTPLSWAAGNGQETVVQLLLQTGQVELEAKDYEGRTSLSWAAANGQLAIVELLLETTRVDVDSQDRFGRTPLSLAAANGHSAVVTLLRARSRIP